MNRWWSELLRHVARRGHPWESSSRLTEAAGHSDAVKAAIVDWPPVSYIERVFRALDLALDQHVDGQWDHQGDVGLFDLYALLVMTCGETVTPEHVHDAWAIYTQRTRPSHPDLVPFRHLPMATARLDERYVAAIRTAAAMLRKQGG